MSGALMGMRFLFEGLVKLGCEVGYGEDILLLGRCSDCFGFIGIFVTFNVLLFIVLIWKASSARNTILLGVHKPTYISIGHL